MPTVHLLDYVAGNIRSLVNAIEKLGYDVEWVRSPEDVANADKLILPGVGHFGHCLTQLASAGYTEPVRAHIASGKPFMGICVGLQSIFAASAETPGVPGLNVIPLTLDRFDDSTKAVPHIGWNDATTSGVADVYDLRPGSKYYYVHSYKCPYKRGELERLGWTVATGTYGSETFVGAVAKGNVYCTQFHPEKSGVAGLRTLKSFLTGAGAAALSASSSSSSSSPAPIPESKPFTDGLTRRVIACLDVRANDAGDLVVTKGDQYDVREKTETGNDVRNLGKPVAMARKYYESGADEVTFLNITSFRDCPVRDLPMLDVLRQTSRTVFVPLTVGGGIRDTVDADGTPIPALDVAKLYFASGADKVSIGSDAVAAAEAYHARGRTLAGDTAIEQISRAYGNQAVVVSVDPKRVALSPAEAATTSFHTLTPPDGGAPFYYACTVRGGRETRPLDVVQLCTAVEAMGCGEILLNCIDRDGTNAGFDFALINQVKSAVRIPVIASSGAGRPAHFAEVFRGTATDAALGAGMFHRGEYEVRDVKEHLEKEGLVVRGWEGDL